MKRPKRIFIAAGLSLALAAGAWGASKAELKLPAFEALSAKATETVNITLGPELLALATRFLDDRNPADASARQAVASLRGIYVRSFSFDRDFDYPRAEVDAVRRQLDAPGWNRIVGTFSRKEDTKVDIFVLIENGRAMGLALIASEPRQFTVVNIVGSIDLERLHDLQGHFGVPNLELEKSDKPKAEKIEKKSSSR
jgi:hypothetical protein